MPDGFHSRSIAGGMKRESQSFPLSRRISSNRPPRSAASRVRRVPLRIHATWKHLGWKRFVLRVIGIGALVMCLYFFFLWATLPNLDDPYNSLFAAAESTVITDRNGEELYRVHGEQDRTIVKSEAIADSMKMAMVAIEDERFYDRGCIDMRAMMRAIVLLGRAGGASTITRQLARNALNLQQDSLLNRKLKELFLGCQLEGRYSKDELLNLYLNWVPFGVNIYGVEQASLRYFGKHAKDLTLAEAALIASIPQRPSYFNPYGRHVYTTVSEDITARIIEGKITKSSQIDDEDVTIGLIGAMAGTGASTLYVGGRTDQVLHNMLVQGLIKEEDQKKALEELRTLAFKPSRDAIRSPYFVLWMKEQVEDLFEGTADSGLLEQGGLTIETTLDWRLQEAAEAAIAKHKDTAMNLHNAHNIALVAMDPRTKEVLAYVGNTSYNDETKEGKIDMAQVPRQPGSSFKPFVYAAAFEKGFGPATVLYDVPTKFGPYEPQNYEGGFWGLTNARKALGGSRNIPAVKAYFLGGEEEGVLDLVARMGAPTPQEHRPAEGYGPPLAIGAGETPLLEMVQGYATLADAGRFKPAISIRRITGQRGTLLPLPTELDPSEEGTEVLDPRVAYQITSILSDPSVRPGEYWRTILTVPGTQAAAKTGTSNKCMERDDKEKCLKRKPDNVWTIGYSPSIVVGVWVGNATSEPLNDRADGITIAAPIWKEFMTRAQKILKTDNPQLQTTFKQPDGMVQMQISLLSGELPTECTPVAFRGADIFLQERVPTRPDPACASVEIDKATGLLASASCPVEAREAGSFFDPHSILGNVYPSWEQGVQKWAQGLAAAPEPGVEGAPPPDPGAPAGLPLPLVPTEACDISKTPERLERPTITLLSPSSGGSATYPSFQPQLALDVASGIRELTYVIDGKPAAKLSSPPFEGVSIQVPRSIGKDGTHVLRVTVTDTFYNRASDEISFSFHGDASGPRISLISPLDGDIIQSGSGVVITADASDSEGGIKYVEFYLDDILLTRKPREPFSFTYEIPAGPHTVRVIATDLAGNTAEDRVGVTVTE